MKTNAVGQTRDSRRKWVARILFLVTCALIATTFVEISSARIEPENQGQASTRKWTEAGSTGATPTPGACVTQPLTEGFESGTIGTQFTSSAPICEWPFGGCQWSANADEHNTGAFSANAPALADITDLQLTTNDPINIPSGASAATLEFWHIEAFEGGDGGILETSTDGGATWQDAGPNIIQGGYDSPLGGSGNPLAGRQGWGEYSFGAWWFVRVNLLPYAGHDLHFRYRLGTNNNGGTDGWFVDDILVRITAPCITGTVVPPTRTSTRTPSLTLTPLPTCLSWTRVQSPDPTRIRSFLYDVEVIAPNDIWAVGQYNTTFGLDESLILHWNGTQWSLVSGPGVENSGLYGVSAAGPNDIWAVGYYIPDEFGIFQPLTVHWNGTAWSSVPSPGNPGYETILQGVGVVSTNDVWAVGENEDGPMVMHWNGSSWAVTPHPLNVQSPKFEAQSSRLKVQGSRSNVGPEADRPRLYWDSLYAVGVVSANDVWAVGSLGDHSLAMHWDGTAWNTVGTPNPYNTVILRGISVLSANDIWAVGSTDFYMNNPRAVVIHWNGQAWSNVQAPSGNLVLNDVAALSANEIWAVGYEQVDEYHTRALLLRRTGAQWVRVPSPNPTSPTIDELHGIEVTGSTEAWAVGSFDGETLVDRYSNTCGGSTPMLVGHVNWESRPAQPSQLQSLPITITLKSGATEVNYPSQVTDQHGYFTVALGSLPNGTYSWRADDSVSASHPPNYLAKSGTVNLTGAPVTNMEVSLMRAGDADNSNGVNVADFNILKVAFGFGCGYPAYDVRADFTGDCVVNVSDFNPLKANFGQGGAPPITPR